MMLWVWGIVTAVCLILEFVSAGLLTIWFAAGAFVALLVEIIFPSCPVLAELAIFVVMSMLLLISTRAISRKLTKGKEIKTNLDSYIGKTFKINKLSDNGYAYIKSGDIEWRVVEKDEKQLNVGDMVEILSVTGIKFAVKKVESTSKTKKVVEDTTNNEKKKGEK